MTNRRPGTLRPADKSADPVIEDAVNRGYVDSEAVYVIPGFTSHATANNGRLAVNRSGRRLNLSPGAWVSDDAGEKCYKDCQAPDGPHQVRFRLWSKNRAREHVFRESGGDPSKLKYNPWTSHRNRPYDDSGHR